jgi:hypothetical protein
MEVAFQKSARKKFKMLFENVEAYILLTRKPKTTAG